MCTQFDGSSVVLQSMSFISSLNVIFTVRTQVQEIHMASNRAYSLRKKICFDLLQREPFNPRVMISEYKNTKCENVLCQK
jgi:hypothetical protein